MEPPPLSETKHAIREQVPLSEADYEALGDTNRALCIAVHKKDRLYDPSQLESLESIIAQSLEAENGHVIGVTRVAKYLLVVLYSSTAVRDEALGYLYGRLVQWEQDCFRAVVAPFPRISGPHTWFVPVSLLTSPIDLSVAIEALLCQQNDIRKVGSLAYDIRRLLTAESLPTSTFAEKPCNLNDERLFVQGQMRVITAERRFECPLCDGLHPAAHCDNGDARMTLGPTLLTTRNEELTGTFMEEVYYDTGTFMEKVRDECHHYRK